MPINIYVKATGETLDQLCDDIWDLMDQISALESWLNVKGKNLIPNIYVADIGFDIRKDETGGGSVLTSESMTIMGRIGMDVYLSDYPSTAPSEF